MKIVTGSAPGLRAAGLHVAGAAEPDGRQQHILSSTTGGRLFVARKADIAFLFDVGQSEMRRVVEPAIRQPSIRHIHGPHPKEAGTSYLFRLQIVKLSQTKIL